MTPRDSESRPGAMAAVNAHTYSNRVAHSHEKKFMAAKNTANQPNYSGMIRPPQNNHQSINMSSLSSIMNGTPRQTR